MENGASINLAWDKLRATCLLIRPNEVVMGGTARRFLGRGMRGLVDGPEMQTRLSFPNGVACDPWAPRVYINEYLNDSESALPRRMIVCLIDFEPRSSP